MRFLAMAVTLLSILTACQPPEINNALIVFIVADGRERTYSLEEPLTVEQFLAQPYVDIVVGETDRLTPPRFTQLSDGMRITIVRVRETSDCEDEMIPFSREVIQNEGLQPSEQRIVQTGQNGRQQVCYRTVIEDGVETSRLPVGQPTVLTAPTNEIMVVGINTNVEPIPVAGTLAYINNKNAWVITGMSTTKQPLTTTGNLDSLVFELSPDGRRLLYTVDSADDAFVNELWMIETTPSAQPVKLVATNVIYAEWIPGQENLISYSTSEPQDIVPYWRSLNNVLTMEIDPTTGQALNNTILIPESGGGFSGWWGTVYKWSPDGATLAWVRADSMGIVNEDGGLEPLLNYPLFRTSQNWSWRSNVSWSPDASLLATLSHGAPIGNEPAETSPVFDAVVVDRAGTFDAPLEAGAGMWSSPTFAPVTDYLAFLRAREPYNSVNGEYDLVVADRDGSNARAVFPAPTQPGITTRDFGVTPTNYGWSPDGLRLVVTYLGNIWLVDADTGVSHQLTFDGQSENPIWKN